MKRGPAKRADDWFRSLAFLLLTGQENVARTVMAEAYPEMVEACRRRGELTSTQARADSRLEAVAFLVLSGKEGVARSFLEALHPKMAETCRREPSTFRRMLSLSGDALCLVNDLAPSLGRGTGSGDDSL